MTRSARQAAATLLSAMLLLQAPTPVMAADGNWPPAQLSIEGLQTPLRLAQTGKAYYLRVIHVYDAALYTTDGHAAFDSQTLGRGICLQLRYLREIRADQLIEASDTSLANLDPPPDDALQAGIARIHAAYRDVKEGDRYTLCAQGTRTWLMRDGTQVASLDQPGFGALYLGVWLGPHALSPKLREALLAPR